MPSSHASRRIVDELARRMRQVAGAHRQASQQGLVSSGSVTLDRLLPAGGFTRGTLVEWLSDSLGAGAGTLALLSACQACRDGRPLVVLDQQATFYPPAAMALGCPAEQLVVVRTRQARDAAWAFDQVLRCRHVAAVVWSAGQVAPHVWRRFQLAAQRSGVLGILLRANHARREPSWAETRLLVRPRRGQSGRRVEVTLLRSRGLSGKAVALLDVDEMTGGIHDAKSSLPVASQLAGATRAHQPAGWPAARSV